MKRRQRWLWILAIAWVCFSAPAAEALVGSGPGSAAEAPAGADPADVEMIRRGLDATVSIVNLVQGANFRRKNNLECFVAGTLVETQDGPRPIEQVREGDWVLAWDEDAGELCWSRVEQTFVTPRQPIWRLTLKLPDGSEESLDCTPGHPFWVDGAGWISASHLQPGQDVATLSGPARVASVAPTGRNRTVYNFEVEGTHCYFVGTGGELVHNAPCGVPKNNWGQPHGSPRHWNRITQSADKMNQLKWRDIRVNRRQVDAAGKVVGKNRPDLAGINPRTNVRHNVEFDTNPASSARHRAVVNANDPAAKNTFIRIP